MIAHVLDPLIESNMLVPMILAFFSMVVGIIAHFVERR
jgi:hypothetical protein